MVSINVRDGLADEMDLCWGRYTHTQKLDYENVPSCCRRCHAYGHLIAECKLSRRYYNESSSLKVMSDRSSLFIQPVPLEPPAEERQLPVE